MSRWKDKRHVLKAKISDEDIYDALIAMDTDSAYCIIVEVLAADSELRKRVSELNSMDL